MRTPNSRTRRRMLKATTAYCPIAAMTSETTEKISKQTRNHARRQRQPLELFVHRASRHDREAPIDLAKRRPDARRRLSRRRRRWRT